MLDERLRLPSASSVERLVRCPGSPALIESIKHLLPPPKDTPESAEGTLIHDALEDDDASELDMSQESIAERLVDMRKDNVQRWGSERELDVTGKGEEFREERFFIRDQETLEPVCSARVDYAVVCGNDALVLNYKTGYSKTESAALNWQARTEALCLWSEFPNLERIRVGIAQYRFKAMNTLADYERADLQLSMLDLWRGIWASKQPDAPRFPGRWCRYCPAIAHCMEAINWAMVTGLLVPKNGGMKLAETRVLLEVKKRWALSQFIYDGLMERLRNTPEATLKELGYCLKPGVKVTNFNDIPGLFGELTRRGLTTPEEFTGLFAGAKIKGKLMAAYGHKIKAADGLKNKEQVEAAMDVICKPYVETHEGKKRIEEIQQS